MWKCSKCGEEIEDQFDQCWRCATDDLSDEDKELLDLAERKPQSQARFWIGFGIGVAVLGGCLLVAGLSDLGLLLGLTLGPFVAGTVAAGGLRGGTVGFLVNFAFGFILPLATPRIGIVWSVCGFPIADMNGFIEALVFGFGWGIWPGFVLGLLGGLVGIPIRKAFRV